MSKYTTGEMAKYCNVSVRTVQYYDTRGILTPSELSEGGRRLYSENELKRLKIICFLRNAGLSINSIGELLNGENPENVISILLDQQNQLLKEEINERQNQLAIIEGIKRELKNFEYFSVESIGDIAYTMENKKKLHQLHLMILFTAIPISIVQWGFIIFGLFTQIWWPAFVCLLGAIIYAIWLTNFYFKRVAYICPHCHEVFKPKLKEAIFARHTPTLRKLTCPICHHKGFCIETYHKKEKN